MKYINYFPEYLEVTWDPYESIFDIEQDYIEQNYIEQDIYDGDYIYDIY